VISKFWIKASRARASLPPNTFSNRLDRQCESPVAATVLLFDSLNTKFKDQADARRQMLRFLKALDPETPIAIYALGNNLRIIHDFTQDQASLTRALERYHNSTSTALANSQDDPQAASAVNVTAPGPATLTTPDTADLVSQILEPLQEYSIDRRVAITLSAMDAIASRMAGVPGRKNLIWISGAFPLSIGFDRGGLSGPGQRLNTYSGPMRDAAMAIDQANVSIYPIDARGLLVQNTVRTEMPTLRNQTGLGEATNMPTPEYMAGNQEFETMKLLADWTGGKAFYNSNDIRGAVKQATEDAEVTYTLGFYADEKDLDGSYREVKCESRAQGHRHALPQRLLRYAAGCRRFSAREPNPQERAVQSRRRHGSRPNRLAHARRRPRWKLYSRARHGHGALALTAQGIDLADALHLTSRPAGAVFVSFDRSFVRRAKRASVPGVSVP